MTKTRRSFLSHAVGGMTIAVFGLAFSSKSASASTCYDPEKLPRSQKNRRRGLDFKEESPAKERECRGCAFFTPEKVDVCGKCTILDFTVNAGATCNSFTPRP